jgi:hypothetical protein
VLLDKRTSALMSMINEECNEGSFKVLEIEDIIASLPKRYKLDRVNLKQMMDFLVERDFLEVKYYDDNEYCLSPMPKGRLYHEQAREEKKIKARQREFIIYTIMGSFFAAFAGALLGIMLFLR